MAGADILSHRLPDHLRLGKDRTRQNASTNQYTTLDFCASGSLVSRQRMDEKQLAKLIRKNVEKAEKLSKGRAGKNYDNTLPQKPEDDNDIDRDHFFKEMKRREF